MSWSIERSLSENSIFVWNLYKIRNPETVHIKAWLHIALSKPFFTIIVQRKSLFEVFLDSLHFRPEVNNLFSVRFSYVFYTHDRKPASHFCLGQRNPERFSSAAVIYEPLFSGSAGENSERDWGQSPVYFWENGKHVPVRAKRARTLWNETRRRCRTKLLEACPISWSGCAIKPPQIWHSHALECVCGPDAACEDALTHTGRDHNTFMCTLSEDLRWRRTLYFNTLKMWLK